VTTSRIAIVTGATQGLGLALVAGLAARLNPADLVLLTGRDPARVAAALAGLGDTTARVQGRVLDVTDGDAVRRLAGEVGAVDIAIANAGARMTPDRTPAEQIDALIDVNNLGSDRMLRYFGPSLRPGGRLLVVASSFGTLRHLDPRLRPRFDEARTLDEVDQILKSWRAAVHDGTAEREGYPRWINIPSKVAQVAAVRAVAAGRRERDRADGTLIAAICPGLIDTEASRPWFPDMSDAQSPAQAAAAVLDVVLASRPDPAWYGELVRDGRVLPWHDDSAGHASREYRVSPNG
jgi:carbonyl reductase 1